MKKIGVLISGGGTNLQALMDNINEGNINGEISLIISNKKNAYGLERGNAWGIESIFINPKDFENEAAYNFALINRLKEKNIDLVVLAGYLKILSKDFVEAFENRVINIHPSLIPSFCGSGFYGERIHKEVLNYGCKITGATVHFVDEGTDTGPIIFQKIVEIENDESVKSLKEKVLKIEHEILTKAVKLFCEDKIVLEGRKTKIIQEGFHEKGLN